MKFSILKLFVLIFLFTGVAHFELQAQCIEGVISGYSKTGYCFGVDGAVSLSGEGLFFGDPVVLDAPVYTISPGVGSGFIDNGNGTAVFNPNQVGIGTFTITLDFDPGLECKEVGTVTFTVFEIETITIEIDNSACEGTDLNLSTSETFENVASYSWSGPNGFSTSVNFPTIPNATSANSGTYAVTVVYETRCTTNASRDITINPAPSIQLNSNNPTCIGDELSIQTSGGGAGGSYSWTGPGNFSFANADITIADLTAANAGTYALNYTAATGCSTMESVSVTLAALPTPTLSTSGAFCLGDPSLVVEDNNPAAYTYNWLNENGTNYTEKVINIANPVEADAGTYTVTVTNSDGCSINESITIGYNGETPQLAITGETEICAEGSISLSETGDGGQNHVWTGPNNLEFAGANLQINNITNQNTGLYEVSADNGNGCSANTSIEVNVNALPNLTLAANDTEPCEGSNLQLSETSADLVSWEWTGPNNFSSDLPNPSITNVGMAASGAYNLIGINAAGCMSEQTIGITVNPTFNAGTGRNTQICSGPVVNLRTLLLGSDDGGIFIDDSGAGTLDGTNLATENLGAGRYLFSYTSDEFATCNTISRVAVIIRAAPSPELSTPTAFCLGETALTLADIGQETYTYNWLNETTQTNYTGKTVIIDNPVATDAGDYVVSITNSNGCESVENFSIIYNGETPQLNIAGENAVCAGSNLILSETSDGGQNHVWTDPNNVEISGVNLNLENVTSLNDGLYSVTADNGNGCMATTTFNLTVNDLPIIELSSTDSELCEGTDVQLNENGGDLITWNWTGPNNFSSNDQNPNISAISLLASGTYTLNGTDDNGCSASSNLAITVNRTFNAGTARDIQVCTGSQLDLTNLLEEADPNGIFIDEAGTGALNGNILETTDLAPGDYNFRYSLAESSVCISSTSFFVRVRDQLNAGEDISLSSCQEETLDLSELLSGTASPEGVFIDIGNSGGLQGSQFDGADLTPSTYQIIYRVGEGSVCPIDEATISINLNPVPATPTLSDATICEGENLSLTATEGSNYDWSNGATTQNIDIAPLITTTYGVTVTNDFNCRSTGEATITVNTLPTLAVSADASICEGSNIQLTADGAVTYEWSPSLGLDDNTIANPIASPNETTTYEVEGISGEGCTAKASVNIAVNDRPMIIVSEDTSLCLGMETSLSATGEGTVNWSPAIGLNNASSNTPIVNPTITTAYLAVLTDVNGCTDTGRVQVMVNDLPVIELGADQTICQGENLELIASGGVSYLWDAPDILNDPTSATQLVSPNQAMTYQVKVTDENSCEATEAITVFVNEIPIADAGLDQMTCTGLPAVLTGSGGGTYEWSNGSLDAVISVSPDQSTTYTLIVTNEFGCTASDEVLVNLVPDFEVATSPDTFYCLGESTQLSAEGGVSYTWTPAIGLDDPTIANPIANPVSTTTYEVAIKDEIGCLVRRQIAIEVKEVENFSITENQDVCIGNNVNLVATGGANYTWTPTIAFENPNQANQELMPIEDAIYQVEVEDVFGCKTRDSVQVIIRPLPTVEATASDQLCEGETLDLEGRGTGVMQWLWEGNGFTSAEQNAQLAAITINQSGQFKLTGTSEFGCESTDNVVVIVNALPTAEIAAAEKLCENASLILNSTNDTPNLIHEWIGADGTNFEGNSWDLGPAQISFSGSYQLMVTDELGCSNQTEQQIEIVPMPEAGQDTLLANCQGTEVNLTNLLRDADANGLFELGAGLSILENNIVNTEGVAAGNYVINYRVVVETCPDDVAELRLKIDTPKAAGLDNTVEVCQGMEVALNELLQDADEGGIYQPLTNAEALDGNTWQTNQLSPATYLIDYVQANACGTDQAQLAVNVLAQVKAGADVQIDLCKGSPFDLGDLLNDADEGGEFQDLSGTNALAGSILTTQDLPIGDYQFDYLITSNNNCPSDAATIDISLKEILTAGLDNTATFCTGPTVNLTELLIDADNGGDFIPIGIAPPNLSGNSIETANLPSSGYTFEYKVGGTIGCPEDVATIIIDLNESPTLELIVPDTFICVGDTIMLEASATAGTGVLQLSWQTPNGIVDNAIITANAAGNYQAIVVDEKACSAMMDASIASNVAIDLNIEGRAAICQSEDLTLQPSVTDELLNYTWLLPNGEMINEAILIVEAADIISGNYELAYRDQFNCSQSVTKMITLSPGEYFKSNFLTTNFACLGDSVQLIEISEIDLSANATFEWDFGDGQTSTTRDPAHVFQSSGLFPVSVIINDQNCGSESIEKEINIVSCRKLPGSNRLFKFLNLYPNPTSIDTKLEIVLEKEEEMLMSIRDIHGRIVQEKVFQKDKLFREAITIQEPGMYFIYLKTLGEQKVIKLVVE